MRSDDAVITCIIGESISELPFGIVDECCALASDECRMAEHALVTGARGGRSSSCSVPAAIRRLCIGSSSLLLLETHVIWVGPIVACLTNMVNVDSPAYCDEAARDALNAVLRKMSFFLLPENRLIVYRRLNYA